MESNNFINYDKEHLRQFIAAYRNHPVLWDNKCPNYSKKDKRYEAYQELLRVYRLIRPEATITDVKKKINSMRSNFRKEMKKVEESALIGVQYRPSSWMYDELIFLSDSELLYSSGSSMYSGMMDSTLVISDEEETKNYNDFNHHPQLESNEYTHQFPNTNKKAKYCESNELDAPTPTVSTRYSDKILTKNYSNFNDMPKNEMNSHGSSMSYYDDLTKVWATKLKYLEPLQRVLAEKFINDILFEAQLGSLHRDSLKIDVINRTNIFSNRNEETPNSEPSQSSPEYKFSHSYGFTENVRTHDA